MDRIFSKRSLKIIVYFCGYIIQWVTLTNFNRGKKKKKKTQGWRYQTADNSL